MVYYLLSAWFPPSTGCPAPGRLSLPRPRLCDERCAGERLGGGQGGWGAGEDAALADFF